MTINSGFSHWKWWFSIAMLNYQRVYLLMRSLSQLKKVSLARGHQNFRVRFLLFYPGQFPFGFNHRGGLRLFQKKNELATERLSYALSESIHNPPRERIGLGNLPLLLNVYSSLFLIDFYLTLGFAYHLLCPWWLEELASWLLLRHSHAAFGPMERSCG